MDNLITSASRVIGRADGSEVRIVAQAYFGRGLHRSIGVDVFRRNHPNDHWHLCNDRPHPDWRTMPVDEYIKHGRSEKLQTASTGEILSVTALIGTPMQ